MRSLVLVCLALAGQPFLEGFEPPEFPPAGAEVDPSPAVGGVVLLPGSSGAEPLAGVPLAVTSPCRDAPFETVSGAAGRFGLSADAVGLSRSGLACPMTVEATLSGWSASATLDAPPRGDVELLLLPDDRDEPPPETPRVRGHVFVRNYVGELRPAAWAKVVLGTPDPKAGHWCDAAGPVAVSTDGGGAFEFAGAVACAHGAEPSPLEAGVTYLMRASVDEDWEPVESTVTVRSDVHRVVFILPRRTMWIPGDGLRPYAWDAKD